MNTHNSWILKYLEEIRAGNILVGQETILQLEMLEREIKDPVYQQVHHIKVEFKDSEKRINFIEKECKLYEAPFAGKPFILDLFQKAIAEATFAIKIWDEELNRYVRKYQEVLLVIGRKNGKTPFSAALCLAEWFCGPLGTKILCASNDYDQAGIMFDGINAMREESTTLAKVTHKNQTGMYFGNRKMKNKKGKFSKQNKGSIKKLSAKTGNKEGKNILMGAVDEIHEMKDNSLAMPIRQALSTQDEPLYLEITTEGFTQDGYLDERLKDARQVLKGELDRPRWLIFLYTQDSETEIWQDESSWVKSNPGLGTIKKWSFLRKMIEEAKTSTKTRAFVLSKDFNIKQNTATAWLQEADIINTETFDFEKFRGFYYIGAIDYAETTDLVNVKALFIDPETKKKYTLTMYFIPDSKADVKLYEENGTNPEKKDYYTWQKQRLVTICPGAEVDSDYIANWFYSLYTDYEMVPFKIGYDNWHMKELKKKLADYFGDEVLERVNMDFASLSNAMDVVEADLKAKRLIYNNHDMDIWCLRNTSITVNKLGQIMPIKVRRQSKNRIDGALGFIIAEATLSRYRTEYMQLIA